MLRNTELRKLPAGQLYNIAAILETNNDWKKVMSFVPRNPRSDHFEPKYNNEHIKIIEEHARATNKKCAEILFEEWGTSGRIRPTLGTLKDVVEKAGILRAADELADMLQEKRPSRPEDGPGAEIEMNITEIMMQQSSMQMPNGSTKRVSDAPKPSRSFGDKTTTVVNDTNKENPSAGLPNFDILMPSERSSRNQNNTDGPSFQMSLPNVQLSTAGIDSCILSNTELIDFPYQVLETITMKFSENLIFIPDADQGKLAGKIGSGGFGDVYAGFHPNFGQVAVKISRTQKFDHKPETILKVFNAEVKFLSQMRHKNIVPLIGFSIDGPCLCIVCEYIDGGSLEQKLALKMVLTEKQRLNIMIGTAEGLKYLHDYGKCESESQDKGSESQSNKKHFIHGDVKSANILLTRDCVPKLCDFGLAKQYDKTIMTTSPMGTSAYMAPEGFAGTITQKTDIYSYGIVLLELLTGLKPVVVTNQKEMYNIKTYVEENCSNNEITSLLSPFIDKWTKGKEIYSLARTCLVNDRRNRPTAGMICETLYKILDEKENPHLT